VKIARNLAIVLALLLLGFLVLQPIRRSSIRARAIRAKAATIQVGDDTNQVRSVLGKPTETITVTGGLQMILLDGAAETWSYTSSLNFLKIHLTDTNDVAVYFDSTGRVMRMQIPNR
jgi:outer membrane protein assembly factor BamE (lipoprotein component of BamABCDE complex)